MVPRTVMVEEDYEDYEVHYVDEQRTEYRTEEQEVERIVYETYEREVPVSPTCLSFASTSSRMRLPLVTRGAVFLRYRRWMT
jgi:hypothetical protein